MMYAPQPSVFEQFLRWTQHRLSPTMTYGEALLLIPLMLAWLVSLVLVSIFLHRWIRRLRTHGNGRTLVARANLRREAYRTLRLTLGVAAALGLATNWMYAPVLFVIWVLGYAFTELVNSLMEVAYQWKMDRFLDRLERLEQERYGLPPIR